MRGLAAENAAASDFSLCGVVHALVDGSDAMQTILDRKLLLFDLLDLRGVGMRPRHQRLKLIIQMLVVTLQALPFQMLHVIGSQKKGVNIRR